MKTNFESRNLGLDIMRACAISLVVGMHLIGNFFPGDYGIFWYLAYLGVDIFFVLSGFLIGTILINSIDPATGRLHLLALRRFYIRRWLRTIPLYYFLLLLNFFIGRYYFGNGQPFNMHYLFWLQNFFSSPESFFGESWSLSIEEWFYFLFPLGLYLFYQAGNIKKAPAATLLLYTSIFILGATGLRAINLGDPYRELNIVITRMDAIGYGVLFAVLDTFYLAGFFKRNSFLCGACGIVLLTAAVFFFLYKKLSGSWYVLYYPLSGVGLSLIIIYMKQVQRYSVPVAIASFFEKVSKISYSLYLNNLLIIYIVLRYVHLRPALQMLFALFCIVLFSEFTYTKIEKRILVMRDRFYPSLRHAFLPVRKHFPIRA